MNSLVFLISKNTIVKFNNFSVVTMNDLIEIFYISV